MAGKSLARPFIGTPLVNEAVVGDSEKPSLEIVRRTAWRAAGFIPAELKLRQMRKRLEQRLLRQVLGRMAVVRQMIEPAIQPVPVALDQHRKGLPVSLLGTQDQDVFLIERVRRFFQESHADGPFQA